MHSFVLLLNVLFVTATESLEYGRFTLEFECLERTATRFHYFLSTPESGFVKRPRSFYYDPWLRRKCQQLSLKPYDKVRANYTRGHLVTSGDFKDDEMARRQTHFMTNIVPQTKQLNEGPWAETENIASCLRPNVEVMGGSYSMTSPMIISLCHTVSRLPISSGKWWLTEKRTTSLLGCFQTTKKCETLTNTLYQWHRLTVS